MRRHAPRRLIGILVLAVAWAGAALGAQHDAALDPEVQRAIEVLQLRPGMTAADVGAGEGRQTRELARHVRPGGRVYSTDINPRRVEDIEEMAAREGLGNVTVVRGASDRTNLPDACCDAVLLRNVYHHFAELPAITASLLAALKPGGRLLVIDFAPGNGRAMPPGRRAGGGSHGVLPAAVVEELQGAGFRIVRRFDDWEAGRSFAVLAERPR
jgi:ubiquinone/menaquinone biosynthesis C-methylase UbiE